MGEEHFSTRCVAIQKWFRYAEVVSYENVPITKYYYCDQIEDDKRDNACSMHAEMRNKLYSTTVDKRQTHWSPLGGK
jgi:hypothetical protein